MVGLRYPVTLLRRKPAFRQLLLPFSLPVVGRKISPPRPRLFQALRGTMDLNQSSITISDRIAYADGDEDEVAVKDTVAGVDVENSEDVVVAVAVISKVAVAAVGLVTSKATVQSPLPASSGLA
jgi:hypothetical protein